MLTHCFNYDFSSTMESPYKSKAVMNKHLLNQLKDVGYSSNSIINSMELFAEAVSDMDETILVPSRLMDLKIEDPTDCKSISSLMNLPDLYTLYRTVQNMRGLLHWGGGSCNGGQQQSDEQQSQVSTLLCSTNCSSNNNNYLTTPVVTNTGNSGKGHARRPSTASMSSTNSSAASIISETESEGSVENDSGIDADTEKKITSLEALEIQFQKNLSGLRQNLKQLTEAAHYVTQRYQKDVLGIL